MRTTLSIDDEVMDEVRRRARRRRETIGETVTYLVRRGLTAPDAPQPGKGEEVALKEFEQRFGFRPLPRRSGAPVTNDLVNDLREELGI